MHERQRLNFVEKVGYSLGDAAASVVFTTMILFQQNFYTDIFGLSLNAAACVLLLGRMWDAFFDPIMGVLADRTSTRWGKFRPWLLWTSLPLGAFLYLAYSRPDLDGVSLALYAMVTNVALMTLYSANNTPYVAMTAAMTGDSHERTVLSSYRFFATTIANLMVGGLTLPLVAHFGQDDKVRGWKTTMALWALMCVVLSIITFLTTRERIQPPTQKPSVQDFRNLLKNRAWTTMFALTFIHFAAIAMRSGNMKYFFDYYIDSTALLTFLKALGIPTEGSGGRLANSFGLVLAPDGSNASAVGFSLFTMSAQLIMLVGVSASSALAHRFGKKHVAITCFMLATVCVTLFIFLPADKIWAIFALEAVRALCYGPTIPLLWAMFADVVDFGEWRMGRRNTGVIYATILFALKAGLTLGGVVSLWLLESHGYLANAEQSSRALAGIRMIISIYPAIILVVICAILVAYPISKRTNEEMQRELSARRVVTA